MKSLVLTAALLASGLSAFAQARPGIEEYLVMGDATRGGGEPQIAVNPRNPKNIVITSMANLHAVGTVIPAPPQGRGGRGGGAGAGDANSPTGVFYRTPGATICQAAVTMDGGFNWKIVELPLTHDQYIRCSDVIAAAGPDGTFYAGGEPLSAPMPIEGGGPGDFRRDCWVSYAFSTDGGLTWSPRVEVMGSDSIRNKRFAPGLKPSINGLPTDRPWIEIDQSTGTVFVTARGALEDRPREQQRWVLSSHDKGKSYGLLYAIDTPEYPNRSGMGGIAAGHGVLAASYFADAAPGGAKCPCLIFELSRDEGKTWERHIVPDSAKMSTQGMSLFIVGDDSKAGRYAIMSPSSDSASLLVTMTGDSGKTWTAPTVAGATSGATISKPWIHYSPKGDLGVMWRSIAPDRSYLVWAALSRDGGKSFSAPLQVSRAASPPPSREKGSFLFGDDLSGMTADADSLHLVWADSRSGFLGVWYGHVQMSAFAEK